MTSKEWLRQNAIRMQIESMHREYKMARNARILNESTERLERAIERLKGRA